MEELKIRITTLTPMLGSLPNNETLYQDFIASKAPDSEKSRKDSEEFDELTEYTKGTTIFPRDPMTGEPVLKDYQLRGFFKAAWKALKDNDPKSKSAKVKAGKKKIDTGVFVEPENIPIIYTGEMDTCTRPLRASTPMGERVSLSNSEQIPAGATMECTVITYNAEDLELVREWLNHGKWNGLGQWRNSGKGTFRWEIVE